MKKTIFLLVILISFVYTNINEAHNYNRYRTGVTLDYFFVTLSPYGEWIEIDYDVYAWHPYDVPYNWQPYTIGRWAWTEYGWYWESYEPFGWATYHYGRWYYDDYYGWLWLPDYEWAPAWVEWRYNDFYIGWAPLSPYARFDINFGIRFSISWRTPYRHWHFVSYNNFCRPNVNIYVERNNYRIYSRTKYRTNYFVRNGRIINRGIDRSFIERRGNIRIRETKLRTVASLRSYAKRSVKRTNEIRMYRPTGREVKSVGRTERLKIKRSGRKISLNREKLAVKIDRKRNPGIIKKKTRTRKFEKNYVREKRIDRSAGKLSKYERKGIVKKPDNFGKSRKINSPDLRIKRKTVRQKNTSLTKSRKINSGSKNLAKRESITKRKNLSRKTTERKIKRHLR